MYTKTEYIQGLSLIQNKLTDRERHILQKLYDTRHNPSTAVPLANELGYSRHSSFNLAYGRIGRKIAEALGKMPTQREDGSYRWHETLINGFEKDSDGHWQLRMLPDLANALEELGLIVVPLSPSEIDIDCDALLQEFLFETDVRESPDNKRRGQFIVGWHDATERGQTYNKASLKRLTWHNLGYRLGQIYNTKPTEIIANVFSLCATPGRE